MKLLTDVLNSRKAQAFLVAVVVSCFGRAANLSDLQITEILQVTMVYILGRAIHDHAGSKK